MLSLQVCKSASLQSASLQVCSLSHTETHPLSAKSSVVPLKFRREIARGSQSGIKPTSASGIIVLLKTITKYCLLFY